MARNLKGVCMLCVIVLNVFNVKGRIFSKSLEEFRNFQSQHLFYNVNDDTHRNRRSEKRQTNFTTNHAGAFHSQISTLTTSTFALNGISDNEAFVHWTGQNNNIVFVLTRRNFHGNLQTSTLWRSEDFGKTYARVSIPDNFLVSQISSSAADKSKTVLLDVGKRWLFITNNTGKSWSLVNLPFQPYRMLIHPSNSNLSLGYSLQEMKLFVSEDFGYTWKLMMERVTERFFWAVKGVDADPRVVHMEIQDPVGPVTYFSCIAPDCKSNEFDKTIGTIDFYSLTVQNEYIFVQKSTDDLTSLYISYKRGPFKKAYFPTHLNALDFNIVDTSDNQVFIAVDHEEDIANLYLSDITGQFYIMSMENVVGMRYPGRFDVDLVKVKGLKGIYIVNQFETSKSLGSVNKQISFITFNKGGRWSHLQVPEQSRTFCEHAQKCNLHLHLGNTNQFFHIPLVETVAEAPGLILAHGSVGEYLDFFISDVFISRDAGVTWTPAPFEGKYFLNIMDQGSAILAVSADRMLTNQMYFSCTEGANWVVHNFTTIVMNVDGVVNEPGARSLISSVFGHTNSSNGWLMVRMDFSSVLTKKCDADDFEMWQSASDATANSVHCLMGENQFYKRRKQLSTCYYGDDYFLPNSTQSCLCGMDDYECDFGYSLDSSGGNICIKEDWFHEDLLPAPHCVNGKYNRSSGYRKVVASNCNGGMVDQFRPVEADCPVRAPRNLKIRSSRSCVPRGVNVTFQLTQELGSEEETFYTWLFGNESLPVTIKGLANAVNFTTSFHDIGTYNVSVLAVNSKGSARAFLPINVEDELKSVVVEIPWGARTGMPSYFNVTVLASNNSKETGLEQSLHFAWQFHNKLAGSTRQLTWQKVIQQEFKHPGEYILTLEVFNSISSVFYTQAMEVYEDATTVRIHFSGEINNYNSSSLNVRQAIAEILCHNFAQILKVRRSRIILSVPPLQPVVGDVTILPPKQNSNESEIYQVVEMLIYEAKQGYLSFPLFTSDDIMVITDAWILDLRTGLESSVQAPSVTMTMMLPVQVSVTMIQEKHSLMAVYVSVPVVLVAVIFAASVIIYYRKKLQSQQNYHPIVKCASRIHHASLCSCDDIQGLEDPEDMIVLDSKYQNTMPTLMILNEPQIE